MTNPASVATILTVAIHRSDSNPVYGRGALQVALDDEVQEDI